MTEHDQPVPREASTDAPRGINKIGAVVLRFIDWTNRYKNIEERFGVKESPQRRGGNTLGVSVGDYDVDWAAVLGKKAVQRVRDLGHTVLSLGNDGIERPDAEHARPDNTLE